jgi:hypothetical protein
MRIFLIFSFMLMLSSCATIEVAKEVTKASQSLKTSVNNMINSNKKTNNINDDSTVSALKPKDIAKEMQIVKNKQDDEKEKIKEQKKIVDFIFLGKTYEEIKVLLGASQLKRMDGNIQILRFDSNNCRLFLFFSATDNPAIVRHFELRDDYGVLINLNKKIQECYKNLNLN